MDEFEYLVSMITRDNDIKTEISVPNKIAIGKYNLLWPEKNPWIERTLIATDCPIIEFKNGQSAEIYMNILNRYRHFKTIKFSFISNTRIKYKKINNKHYFDRILYDFFILHYHAVNHISDHSCVIPIVMINSHLILNHKTLQTHKYSSYKLETRFMCN